MKAVLAAISFYAHFAPYFFAGPPPDYRCGSGPDFRYCVYDPPYGVIEDPQSVVYFLHYGTGDEKSWRTVPVSRVFYAELRRRGLSAPKVIALSYGTYWRFVGSAGGKTPSPLAADFLDHTLPWLDAKFGTPKRRYLWGMSQGGLSAATLLFHRPPMWSGAVLACAALFSIDVFAPRDRVASFAAANRLDEGRVQWGLELVRNRVKSSADWDRENPVVRAAKSRAGLPPIYIDANADDDFGFNLGTRDFVSALKRAGARVDFRESPGGHCEVDAWAESRFLADLLQERR